MNVIRQPRMTVEQFLEWEDHQELRHEFNGFVPQLMAGGTEEQAEIQANIIASLAPRLRGTPCRVLGSELKVRVAGSIRYPDAFVLCSPRGRGRKVVSDPVVVFEILSESTQHIDLVEKHDDYQQTASIQRYVVLEQTHVAALVFTRGADGRWISGVANGPEAVLDMPEIGVNLPLGAFYAGLDLADGRADLPPGDPVG